MTKPEAPEFQIERDYDNQCAHARSMFHMAVQRAEVELDLALDVADETRQARLAELRHASHEPVSPTLEDVVMIGVGVTKVADLP